MRLVLIFAVIASLGTGVYAEMKCEKKPFGKVDGKAVDLYTLTNANGLEMQVTNYGGIVTSFKVPDKAGKLG